jgi:hypothetical protein
VLTALQKRAACPPPNGQQLALLVRAGVLAGALERFGQQRVRERLARDPLRVKHVRLATLARAVLAAGAIRAHVAHVITATGQEDRRVATPAGGALDPEAHDRAELPRPRLERAMTVARDAKVLARDDPAARIDDRRGQRPLVRVDPDHVARPVGRDQRARRTRTGPNMPTMTAHDSSLPTHARLRATV